MARKVSTGRPRRLQSRVQRALEPPQGVSLRVCGIREGFSSSPVAICTVCTLRDLPAKACDAKTAHRTGTGSSGSDQARMRTPQSVSLRVLGGQELFSQDHGSGQRGGSGAGRGVGLFNDRHHGDRASYRLRAVLVPFRVLPFWPIPMWSTSVSVCRPTLVQRCPWRRFARRLTGLTNRSNFGSESAMAASGASRPFVKGFTIRFEIEVQFDPVSWVWGIYFSTLAQILWTVEMGFCTRFSCGRLVKRKNTVDGNGRVE